jgi:hypothetical protein
MALAPQSMQPAQGTPLPIEGEATPGVTSSTAQNNVSAVPNFQTTSGQDQTVSPNGTIIATAESAKNDIVTKQKALDTLTAGMKSQSDKKAATEQNLTGQTVTTPSGEVLGQTTTPQTPEDKLKAEVEAKYGQIPAYTATGEFMGVKTGKLGAFRDPVSLALDPSGNTQATPDQITQYNTTGKLTPTTQQTQDQQNAAQLKADQDELQATKDRLKQLNDGTFPLTADQQAQVDAINKQYDQLIAEQEVANANYSGVVQAVENARGSNMYNPKTSAGNVTAAINSGIAKIAKIESEAQQAVAQMRMAFEDKNYQRASDAYDRANNALKDKQAEIDKIQDRVDKATKDAQDRKDKLEKDIYDRVTKPIQDVAAEAAKNGATADIIANINSAKTVQDALNASQGYLQSGTGDVADYLQYKRDMLSKGLTPHLYGDWKDAEDAKKARLEASKAYSTAYNSAAGKAAAEAKFGTGSGSGGLPPDASSVSSFLNGKSTTQIAAFNSLSDVDKASVMQVINGDALMSDLFASRGIQGSDARQRFLSSVKAVDPTFSENQNKQRYAFKTKWNDPNGKSYQIRTGVNTALTHLARLKELTDGLANNGDFQKANSISNWIASNINSSKPADPNNPSGPTVADVLGQFGDTVSLLATEIARAYKGGVPDQPEIDRQIASINSDKPKNIIQAIINNKGTLMSGLLAAQGQEYKQTMGQYPTDSIVNPEVLDALKSAGVDTTAIESKLSSQGYNMSTPKSSVDQFVSSHPDKAEEIANLYVPGATEQDVLDYINLKYPK